MVHQHFRLVAAVHRRRERDPRRPPRRGQKFLVHPRHIERRVAELGERYRIAVDPRARIWQLSLGEQQRVEILKALYREARILILDEPTAVLTPQEADSLFETLRTMADEGRTVIFISHKLHEVKAVSDNVTVLRAGKTVATVSTADSTPHSLAELMVGRELDASGRERRVCVPGARALELEDVWVAGDRGDDAVRGVTFNVCAGEIVAVAGVAGNGQRELAEVVAGMRPASRGPRASSTASRCAAATRASRSARASRTCPRTACTPASRRASASARTSCSRPTATASLTVGPLLRLGAIRDRAVALIERYDVRGGEPQLPARLLSGGNLQKVVLGREFSGSPRVLVAASPTRGLDVSAIETVHSLPARRRATAAWGSC